MRQPRIAPLSASQRYLYSLVSRLPQVNRTYNVCEAYRIRGELDVDALVASVDGVVSRHEALRTTLAKDGADLHQVVLPFTPGVVRTVDLSQASEQDRDKELLDAVHAECTTVFRLHGDTLARFTLYRLRPDDHVLLLVVHHLVFDGWSLELLLREIGELYRAEPSPLPPVRLQFADYVERQQAWLASDRARAMVEYWLAELAGCGEGATLPYDAQASPALAHAGLRQRLVLDEELTAQVLAVARGAKATPAAVLLFAWQLLIGQAAGASTVVVGVPMSNRTRIDTLGCIGYFVNTHAVRLDLSDLPLRELMLVAAGKLMAAVVNQEMSLPVVVEAARSSGFGALPARLYRTMFTFSDQPASPLRLEGLEVDFWPLEARTRKADATLHTSLDAGCLRCELEYSTSLYRDVTAASFLDRYADLLRHFVTSPDDLVGGLGRGHTAR